MTVTEAVTVKPVKGLIFKHATAKKQFHFGPGERPAKIMRVTAIQKGVVYMKDQDYNKARVSVAGFSAIVGEVVSVPVVEVRLTDEEYNALHIKAHEAGLEAGMAVRPTPMPVIERANPLDEQSPIIRMYEPVEEGVCGFAWVLIKGDTHFARWARKYGGYRSSHGGGNLLWVRHFGQSMERKEAYADAYAAVLREAGLVAYGQSRMD